MGETPYPPLGRIGAARVSLPDSFPETVSGMVKAGELTLENQALENLALARLKAILSSRGETFPAGDRFLRVFHSKEKPCLTVETEIRVVEAFDTQDRHLPLTRFIEEFGDGLLDAVQSQNPAVYSGQPDPRRDRPWTACCASPSRPSAMSSRP